MPVSGEVRIWEWNEVRVAEAQEISGSGIFVRTRQTLPEGSHLTLRVEIPGKGAFTVLGRVVRTVKGGLLAAAGMGIRFLDLMPSQRATIDEFVEHRLSKVAA